MAFEFSIVTHYLYLILGLGSQTLDSVVGIGDLISISPLSGHYHIIGIANEDVINVDCILVGAVVVTEDDATYLAAKLAQVNFNVLFSSGSLLIGIKQRIQVFTYHSINHVSVGPVVGSTPYSEAQNTLQRYIGSANVVVGSDTAGLA